MIGLIIDFIFVLVFGYLFISYMNVAMRENNTPKALMGILHFALMVIWLINLVIDTKSFFIQ